MAISIAWGTKIISVPKADLTLIQSSPEVRELDLNAFRLELKSLESDAEGMPFPDTHNHNTEVELAGLTYARTIEIINGYTIEFEDGQYTVNCVGANHNLSDVKVANQVSLIINNAAGLISNPLIEYSAFNGGVTVDTVNGVSGTIGSATNPIGTPKNPSNNLTDALQIAEYRGLTTFYIVGDITLTSGIDFSGLIFTGESQNKSTITITDGADVTNCEFFDAEITGILDGGNVLKNCLVNDLNYVNGYIENCVLDTGTIQLAGGTEAHFLNCWSGAIGTAAPIIDMGGSGQDLGLRNYNGEVQITNLTGSNNINIDLNSGKIELASSITAGDIVIRGIGTVIDNTTGTATVDQDNLMSKQTITEISWDKIYIDTVDGTAGTSFPIGTATTPCDNLADAKVIADSHKIKSFQIAGAVTMDEDYVGYSFNGTNSLIDTLDTNGYSIYTSKFENLGLTGSGQGYFRAIDCRALNGWTNIEATLNDCVIDGMFTVASGKTVFGSDVSAPGSAIFNLNGTGSVNFAEFGGVLGVVGAVSPSCLVAMSGHYILTIDSSCTAGTLLIAGIGTVFNNGTMSPEYDYTLPGTVYTDMDFMSKILTNKKTIEKSGDVWQLIIYDDDDVTPILTKDLKDKDGNNIDDLSAGTLAQELASSV